MGMAHEGGACVWRGLVCVSYRWGSECLSDSFCSLWDQNALFLHTLIMRAFFEAFQGDGSFVYAMMGGER